MPLVKEDKDEMSSPEGEGLRESKLSNSKKMIGLRRGSTTSKIGILKKPAL
jgi:hypothetical protein